MKKLLTLLLLASACWGQTIRTSGSNVDRTDAEWTAIAAKKTGTAAQQAQWAMLQSYISAFCPLNTTNQGCHLPLAVAYKMDPVTYGGAYADKACSLLKYYVDRQDGDNGGYIDEDRELNNTDAFRWGGPPTATSWAILKDHCNAYDTTVRDRVLETASRAWEILKPDSTYPNGKFSILRTNSSYQAGGNSGIGQVLAMVKLAAATYEPGTYTAPQTTWLPAIKTNLMDQYIIPCLANTTANTPYEVCAGGSWPEGMSEYGPESIKMMVELIDAWRIGTTDVDYWPALAGIFPEKTAEWMIRGTSPTGVAGTYYTLYQPYIYRDVQEKNGQYYGYLYLQYRQAMNRMQTHLERIGATSLASYAQWWLLNIMPVYYLANPPLSQSRPLAWDVVMFDDPDDAGTDYRGVMATDDLSPYMILARSNWTSDATWAGALAMQEGGSHQHGDAGSFNIYRKGKWLTRERPGYLHIRDVNASHLHNSLTLNGHGSNGGIRSGMTDNGNSRVQRRTGGYMATTNDTYAAAQFDLSPAFRFSAYLISPDITTVTRDFFYLKPDIFIVSDRIKYLSGVTGYSIAHIQSEKGAASISGNRATISNASQRLHVTKVHPSTANFLTVQESTCKVLEVKIRNDNSAAMHTDCASMGNNGATYPVTLSGGQGAYAALNGTHTMLNQLGNSGLELYQDGGGISTGSMSNGYGAERFILNSTGLFSGLPAYDPSVHGYFTTSLTRNVQWNDPDINPTSPGTLVTHDPYRLDIHSGRKVNEESFLVVMQGADSTDTPMTVATLTSTTSNATGAAFTPPGGTLTEIIAPTLTTPTYPMCITRTGDPANHYVLGQVPGTTYKVSDSAGVTCINTSGAGSDVVANNAGILNYQVDDSIQSPSITLVATPASLTAACVNGGSNPADQTIALTVTGDGGEAAISFSDDSAAISETLSGGAAPQNTPQTMTVAFGGCSGLSVGTHNLNISVTSGTTYVVNSPLTIPVTVTVTTNPLIAASPASANFTATVSGANPADQTVTITRTVSGDLGSITDDAAWLTVTPSSATGITSQDLTLAVDIAGLDPGQHTATITVASSGASNTPITIPVLLALDNPPAIGVEPRPGTTMIQIPFRAPSRAACTIRACTTAACSSVVASASDGGGHPIRIYTLTGLTAATTYTVQTVCGTEIKARQVTTRAATGGPTITLPIDVFNAVGADNIVVDYGADDTLSETAVNGSCSASRCTATITWTNAFRLLWFQVTFRDSGNNVLKTEAISSRSLIPQ